jgi:hypothetical protein
MRIAYVCYWPAFRQDGVSAKLATQVSTWRALGETVQLFCLTPEPDDGATAQLDGRLFTFGSFAERPFATARLMRAALSMCPDVLYCRYDLFVPPIAVLLRRSRSAIELNGNETDHSRHESLPVRLYSAMSWRTALASATGVLCVSRDLASRLPAGKHSAVIPNTVDVQSRPVLAPASSPRPRLVFLTSVILPVQGVDKLLAMAHALPEFDFVLAGVTVGDLPVPAPKNVSLRPHMRIDEYEKVLATCDVGIGNLALHRNGLKDSSSLKAAEYLTYGLPVVLGYPETAFIGLDPWFMLSLPNREDNVSSSIERIRSFVRSVQGKRVPREEIVEKIDARHQERSRLAFLSSLPRR